MKISGGWSNIWDLSRDIPVILQSRCLPRARNGSVPCDTIGSGISSLSQAMLSRYEADVVLDF